MSAPDELEAIYAAAVAALDAGDYLAAKQGFMKLMARRAVAPDAERSLGAGGRQSIKWRDVDLTSLIAECNKMLVAARSSRSRLHQFRCGTLAPVLRIPIDASTVAI